MNLLLLTFFGIIITGVLVFSAIWFSNRETEEPPGSIFGVFCNAMLFISAMAAVMSALGTIICFLAFIIDFIKIG